MIFNPDFQHRSMNNKIQYVLYKQSHMQQTNMGNHTFQKLPIKSSSFDHAFRATNFIWRNSNRKNIKQNSVFHSSKQTSPVRSPTLHKKTQQKSLILKIDPIPQSNDKFMRSYLYEVKKEHKKQLKLSRKKLAKYSNPPEQYNRPNSQTISFNKTYKAILPNCTKATINTCQQKQKPRQAPQWACAENIDQLISKIRQSVKGNENPQIRQQKKLDLHKMLPGLKEVSLRKKVKKIQRKKIDRNDYKSIKIQPWQEEMNHFEFSIQQYNQTDV